MALYIGLMSGTSLDGVDGVLAELSSTPTATGPMRVLAHHHHAFAPALREQLLRLNTRGGDDTDGLVNLPLGAKEVLAVALVRKQNDSQYRVSMRSKGDVSVRSVAIQHGGGGHVNAAACSITGTRDAVTQAIVQSLTALL